MGRITYRVISEVSAVEKGGNIAVLQKVQKHDGAKPIGEIIYRIVKHEAIKKLNERTQGGVTNLRTLSILQEKMEFLNKASDETKHDRRFESKEPRPLPHDFDDEDF